MSQLCNDVLEIDKGERSKDFLENQDAHYELINNKSLRNFVLRHLTYKYTCPLSVLYGATKSGNLG